MMKLIVLALLAACLANVNGECRRNGVRCLEYTVRHNNGDYEERVYPSIVWVSATAEAKRKTDISRPTMKLLYAYLRGANDRGEKLEMMVPVRTTKIPKGETNIYTMAFPLLPEQSENPPVPTNSSVTVNKEPETVYIVRSFSGLVRQDHLWDEQARILKESVSDEDSVDTTFYYMSVYDSPWHDSDRLNEVWMLKNE